MKTVIKLIFGILAGMVLGFFIVAVGVSLFTDISLSEFLGNLRSVRLAELAFAALVGICTFVLSIFILIPLHEAGHLVCGLLSGYKFVSFRIFNFTFIKIDGKMRVKRFAVAGTGGQCLLTPPDVPFREVPSVWYNAGGVLFNFLALIMVLPLFWLDLTPLLNETLTVFCLTDLCLIVINGVPMKLGGVGNDAYNMLYLRRNPLGKRAFVIQLRSNALIQEGVRPKDMPAEWFEWKTDIDYKNPLEVSVPFMHASRLVDEMEWEQAYRELEYLYQRKSDIIRLYVNEIACELAFCAMVIGRKDYAAGLLNAELRKYIKAYSKVMSSKQRILCGIALCLDDDRDKALAIYNALRMSEDTYLLQGEVKSDLAIMEALFERP